LRWSRREGFVRLGRHLDRLARSAALLGFAPGDPGAVRTLAARNLENHVGAHSGTGQDRRVRLEMRRDGAMTVASQALAPAARIPLLVGLASERTDAGDPFLRHKTTRRTLYEAAFARAAAAGQDEVVFLNRSGFVAEASRNNVFVWRDGRLATPPLASGLLPGVLREELLEKGEAVEENLRVEDLGAAGRWYLGNSLRGLQEARLAGPIAHAEDGA
jgi:para-aminobenzoate synthetase/4-amino-4-deoxychorismate lyase